MEHIGNGVTGDGQYLVHAEVCVIMQSAVPEDDFLTAYVLDADTQAPLIKSVNLT